jgi:hypothetical protein
VEKYHSSLATAAENACHSAGSGTRTHGEYNFAVMR